ncbi:MAG: hypothetical protein IPJ65_01255 [Archangiaceae bacterium]|nr:hypothetical protein [Archangiaceae bacterium]
MGTKRSRRNQKPVTTPRAPMNLKANRKVAPHSKKLLFGEDDELGRELGEEYVRSVTSGEHAADDMRDEEVTEEHGGPFVTTTAGQEFAEGTDESNPADAEVAGVPTVSPLRQK